MQIVYYVLAAFMFVAVRGDFEINEGDLFDAVNSLLKKKPLLCQQEDCDNLLEFDSEYRIHFKPGKPNCRNVHLSGNFVRGGEDVQSFTFKTVPLSVAEREENYEGYSVPNLDSSVIVRKSSYETDKICSRVKYLNFKDSLEKYYQGAFRMFTKICENSRVNARKGYSFTFHPQDKEPLRLMYNCDRRHITSTDLPVLHYNGHKYYHDFAGVVYDGKNARTEKYESILSVGFLHVFQPGKKYTIDFASIPKVVSYLYDHVYSRRTAMFRKVAGTINIGTAVVSIVKRSKKSLYRPKFKYVRVAGTFMIEDFKLNKLYYTKSSYSGTFYEKVGAHSRTHVHTITMCKPLKKPTGLTLTVTFIEMSRFEESMKISYRDTLFQVCGKLKDEHKAEVIDVEVLYDFRIKLEGKFYCDLQYFAFLGKYHVMVYEEYAEKERYKENIEGILYYPNDDVGIVSDGSFDGIFAFTTVPFEKESEVEKLHVDDRLPIDIGENCKAAYKEVVI